LPSVLTSCLPYVWAVLASPEAAEWSHAVLADIVAGRQDE